MIIGGVAASVLGRPRLTQDIDALAIVPEADWASAMSDAARYGIVARMEGALEFARRSRVLLMRHTSSGINLDITFGGLPFEEAAIRKSAMHDVGGLRVRLPRVEDLLVMKAIARRPKDLEDIRGLLAAHPQADVAEARHWVREFATAMNLSDMLDEFDRLLAQRTAGV
ncbi:MAG: nucleotidyl transferase AbiEii/AbiGii toxin family protein [Steroidobacteraceae bacterium]